VLCVMMQGKLDMLQLLCVNKWDTGETSDVYVFVALYPTKINLLRYYGIKVKSLEISAEIPFLLECRNK
jgi:hypothetical protein